jgi:hypothetical protein
MGTSPSTLIYLSSRSSATFSNRNRFDTGVWLLLERETRPVTRKIQERFILISNADGNQIKKGKTAGRRRRAVCFDESQRTK